LGAIELAASLPLRCSCFNRIAAIELAAIGLLHCRCAAAAGALNRIAANELAAIELLRCRRATAACFKSISCNRIGCYWAALLPLCCRFAAAAGALNR
jgi:hypothetical protein